MPGVGAAARAPFLQVTQTFSWKKIRKSAAFNYSSLEAVVHPTFLPLCLWPGFATDIAYLPGIQYLTGGAITAAVSNPEENVSDSSLAKV